MLCRPKNSLILLHLSRNNTNHSLCGDEESRLFGTTLFLLGARFSFLFRGFVSSPLFGCACTFVCQSVSLTPTNECATAAWKKKKLKKRKKRRQRGSSAVGSAAGSAVSSERSTKYVSWTHMH